MIGQVTVEHCVGVGHVSQGGGVGQVACPGMVGHCGQGVRGEQVGGSMAEAKRKTIEILYITQVTITSD